MKKKIFRLLLIVTLIVSVLLSLTACSDEENNEKSARSRESRTSKNEDLITDEIGNSPEKTLKEFAEAINNKDSKNAISLLDIDAMEEFTSQTIKEKDLQNGFEDFFNEEENFTLKISDIKEIDNIVDVLEPIYTMSRMTIVMEGEKEPDNSLTKEEKNELKEELSQYIWISAKLGLNSEYEDIWNEYQEEFIDYLGDNSLKGKDIIIMTNDDGEFKIVYAMSLNYLQNRNGIVKQTDMSEQMLGTTAKEIFEMALSTTRIKFLTEEKKKDSSAEIAIYTTMGTINENLSNDYEVISYNRNTGEGVLRDIKNEVDYNFIIEANGSDIKILEFNRK